MVNGINLEQGSNKEKRNQLSSFLAVFSFSSKTGSSKMKNVASFSHDGRGHPELCLKPQMCLELLDKSIWKVHFDFRKWDLFLFTFCVESRNLSWARLRDIQYRSSRNFGLKLTKIKIQKSLWLNIPNWSFKITL